jgi:hypothetical protein
MSDQELYIELEPDDTEGHVVSGRVATGDIEWIRDRLDRGDAATPVILKAGDDGDDDVEGHGTATLRLQAFDDEDDTVGHALSIHFPSREEADAFRRRLLLTGVLTGTIVLGAASGIGLANLSNDAAGSGAATTAGSVAGMDWTQAERPGQAAAATGSGAGAGMDWTQAERPGQAAAAADAGAAAGIKSTQAVRAAQAAAAADADRGDGPDAPARGGAPTPE